MHDKNKLNYMKYYIKYNKNKITCKIVGEMVKVKIIIKKTYRLFYLK